MITVIAEALYSSGSDVGIHATIIAQHSAAKEESVNVNFLKVSTTKTGKKTSKTFFNTTFIVLFRNYFSKVSPSTLTVNAT